MGCTTGCGQALTMRLGDYITDLCTDELWNRGRRSSAVQGNSRAGNDEDMITDFEQCLHHEYVDRNGCNVGDFYNGGGDEWAPRGSRTRRILESIEDNVREARQRMQGGLDHDVDRIRRDMRRGH